ncbi:MAG: flagellar basal body protein FliL [Sphingomonas bacterium]|uniref:flagellar basal body-associated FliL family protein n=1 Tax=Sphingomonas bacterium TaxID=1895847 RepID=UPI00262A7D6F|nr:flagellar basal body-associated FliL family protein [Sphingomonas bacterium]MDB5694832.1 flagellar basal body protein FliL [Sphingomonas bacterium]
MANTDAKTDAPKKKGKKKLIVMAAAMLVLVGGGVAGGLYAAGAGDGSEHAGPRLVPKSEQTKGVPREGQAEEAGASGGVGKPTPEGQGGDPYASNYYSFEKEFTSNLRDSVHFVQVGVAVSTPYDETVVENLKTNEIAVRSAVLMALGDTTEEQIFTSEGKRELQKRLTAAINATLKQKEGFGGIGNTYFTSFVVQ